MTARIGFIGLGLMGSGMARNIAQKGFALTVYNRTRAKADALQALGPLALFSPELEVLKAEGKAAGEAYRVRLLSERAAGRPSSCPPDSAQIVPDELLAFIKRYPANVRSRVTIRQGVADYFINKYPCAKR